MNDQNHRAEVGTRRHRARGCLTWFSGILALVLGLMLIGAIYELAAETADAQAFPPPGQMVDVGGYRLHLNCSGSGSPTVVIDTGWGDSSAGWGWVQPEVAKTTRICTYDRAGMGWSEASPEPRTAREFAKELHTLLANANEPGPFVLVGHSLAGYTMRVYAHDYPEEVAGLVLIDPQNLSTSGVATPQPAPKPGKTSLPALIARARPGAPAVRRQSRPAAAGSASLQSSLGDPPLDPNRPGRRPGDDGGRGAGQGRHNVGRFALNRSIARQRYGCGHSRIAGTLPPVIDRQRAALCRP